jgi:hypothetical protein
MKTNSLLPQLVFLFLFLLSVENSIANHAAGGNLYYMHVTGNQYVIRTKLYRDCTGDGPPTSIMVHISSAQCNITDSLTLSSMAYMGDYSFCPNQPSTCQGGTQRGINGWEYEGTYNFPSQCSDWLISTSISGRPAGITTIQHPASTDLYLEARLNNLTGDNSSPQFSNVIFDILSGQQFVTNFGFVDMEGDSLSYSLISARSDANTNVAYVPPYSGTQPFTSIPPITIDPVSGDIIFYTTSVESSILVCQVNEFRNGNLIGSEILDLNINTNYYSFGSPAILYGWDQQQTAFYAGPGMMCLTFFTYDPDVEDTIMLTANVSSMPGATFNVAGDYHPTGTLCWNIDSSDVRIQPYIFLIRLEEEGCPGNSVQIWSFALYVTLDTSVINTGVPQFTSVEEKSIVIPNPFHQQAEIKLSKSFENVETELNIFNTQGKLMISRKENSSSIIISNENLDDGIYFFELRNRNGERSTGRFVVN